LKSRGLLNCFWGAAAAILFLSSCASNPPPATYATGGEFAYLTANGSAYFYADVKLSRPIMEHVSVRGVDMTRIGQFLDKVDFLSGAVYPNSAPQHLMLHAWKQKGKVPGASALFFSAQWKKTASPSGGNYYHSERYGLSVSTQGSHAFVSDADPLAFEPAVSAPEGLTELRWEAILLGWLDHAGAPINNFLSVAGIPVRIPTNRILFGVYRSQEPNPPAEMEEPVDDEEPPLPAVENGGPFYELRLRVETENTNQARALTTLLAFVRVLTESPDVKVAPEYLAALRPLLANPPSQVGSDLAIHTDPMSARELALLFNRFSVYSQQMTQ
jgi:hypothetical protein